MKVSFTQRRKDRKDAKAGQMVRALEGPFESVERSWSRLSQLQTFVRQWRLRILKDKGIDAQGCYI